MLIKVCGMTSKEDAAMVSELGADFMGFIFHPKSPRNVTPGFAASVNLGPKKVGVFVNQSLADTKFIMDAGKLDFAQLHGNQDTCFCRDLGPSRVIKAMWPEKYANAREFQSDLNMFAKVCAYFLFDAGKSGGGHGKAFDPGILAKVEIPRPWFLAGGLGPDTIQDALSVISPAGVDLNSGVESAPGQKDRAKLEKTISYIQCNSSIGGK